MPGKHGTEAKNTEVPRQSLVEALTSESDFHDTESLNAGVLFEPVRIEVR